MNDNLSQAESVEKDAASASWPRKGHPPEDWRRLAKLLTTCDANAGLMQTFPSNASPVSVLDALTVTSVAGSSEQHEHGRQLHEKLKGLLGQLSVFEQVSHCPVVAITGLLNAGKSSLLATYLSEAGRARVLRGVGNQQGTHRFVVWMPEVWWSDPQLLSTLVSFMTSVFGHPPEQLSDDIQVAQQQYNGQVFSRSLMANTPTDHASTGSSQSSKVDLGNAAQGVDPISIPLIARDSGLDRLKLGLVDCPDIQTGFLDNPTSTLRGSDLAASRRSQLNKIGRLCSAFVIVSKLSNLHDDGLLQLLTTLRDAMPGVPRILAINKLKARYSPDVVFSEARNLVDRFGIASVFGAYDYRSALTNQFIPKPPDGLVVSGDQPQPIFWDISRQSEKAPVSNALEDRDYLFHLSSRLEAGSLARESHRSLSLQLQTAASETVEWLATNDGLRKRQLAAAWKAIADACYDFMAERNSDGQATSLRLQASPAIVAQLADSFQRTAPAWMRISMTIDRTARQFQQAVSNSASRFKILQTASNSVMQFAKNFRRGEGAQVVTPQRLAESIRHHDYHDATRLLSDQDLIGGCEIAMKRFAAEDKSLLDPKELDAWSKEIWDEMPLKQKLWKGTQPLALLMGPLLAAVLVPIDGGGTAVLVFASAKELLAAAGIAAILGPTLGGGEALKIVHRETPWRQMSDLFAIVCDCLNVPRPTQDQLPRSNCAGELRPLLPCNLPEKTGSEKHPAMAQWKIPEEFQRSLRSAIANCC